MLNKSPNGAGSIYKRTIKKKRSDGTEYIWEGWEGKATVGIDPKTGKPVRRTVTAKTQNECRLKLSELTGQVDDGTYREPSEITVREWMNIWCNEYLNSVKPTTATIYRNTCRCYLPEHIANTKLQKIEPYHIQQMFNALAENLSPKTVKNIHGVFHKSFETACRIGLISENPTEFTDIRKARKAKINTLDRSEVQPFLDAIEDDPFRSIIVFDLFTGLRISEAIGLTWDCVDFSAGTITIEKQLQQVKGDYIWMTLKSDKTRTIAPAAFVIDILREEKVKQAKAKIAAGSLWHNPERFVFTREDGSHMIHNTIRKHFKKAAEKIGRPDLRFHDLRHTFATISIIAGDDFKTIADNMGHYSVAFTMDRYAKTTDEMKKASAKRIQDFIVGL